MSLDHRHLRNALAERRRTILEAGLRGSAACAELSSAVDDLLRTAFDSLAPDVRGPLAVLALGGYGRAELFPHSDIDIMVLRPSGREGSEGAEGAKQFLHILWDAGLDVGHSIRTVEEVCALHGSSLDAWTAVLESRRVCGDADLHAAMGEAAGAILRRGVDAWYIEGILADMAHRLERFGNSVKLLEPNVKKSAGGLRDLHAVYWLHLAAQHRCAFSRGTGAPAMRSFLDELAAEGLLDADQHAAALSAMEFLFRLRQAMHIRREVQHDTLEYALQLEVAEDLGYGRVAELRSVEVFMRDYYRHARTVHRLNLHLSHRFSEALDRSTYAEAAPEAIGRLMVYRDRISIGPGVRRLSAAGEVLDAFALSAERDLDLDVRLRAAIERSADLFTLECIGDPVLAGLFRRILRSDRVSATLRDMNELGILGSYLPEFGDLVAFFQHNVYHYYTADEHTVIALANAERLGRDTGLLRDVFETLQRKDLLYMAILLHDIAKPRGVADHEITGVSMAREILTRLGMQEVVPDVAFLIRHHLAMEQVAFRRNIHDPGTIREFAALFERPELLDYLYVLTYADLSAVNRNVWTGWKAAMLQDLYRRTAEVLRRELRGVEIDAFHRARRDEAIEQIVRALSEDLPRDEVERHLQAMQSDAYVSVFSGEEISQHIREGSRTDGVSAAFAHAGGHTEVTVIAHDAPFALSKFCAVLAANDANIFDANIFTRADGVIIDRFRVVDAATRQHLEPHVCRKIEEDLLQVMRGTVDIDHLFREHHRRWKRRPKGPLNPSIRTDVAFEDTPTFTIIDVYAPDAVGFLYRVTETISRMGLDIYFAKIATRVDGIVDAFYVRDRGGQTITEPGQRDAIRAEILATIASMAETELG